jgi:carbonic anhydrase/acetyltransferase-like protein (isoleucine patch superfamily)
LSSVRLAQDVFVAPGARLEGDVRMAAHSSVWFGAVVIGEAAPVSMGENANAQDNSRLEATPGHPVEIGKRVTIGHNARVFGAIVEEHSLIAIGATVLQGARIGTQSIVAANATVPEGMQVPPRSLVIGHGRIVREVTEAEIARIERGASEYTRLCREHATGRP